MFVDVVVAASMAHSIVRLPEFKKFVGALRPNYKLPETRAIKKIQLVKKEKLLEQLKNSISIRCQCATLSADGWSAYSKSYFGLLLHFIDAVTLEMVIFFDNIIYINIWDKNIKIII
jgi:hypothetical protein